MNKYLLPLALVSVITLQACNQQTAETPEAASAAPTESAPVVLETPAQRISYGIAFNLLGNMAADGLPIDLEAFQAGVKDAFEGANPKLTQEEVETEMRSFWEKVAAEQEAVQAELMAANAALLEKNATMEGVVVTDSGLQYQILEEGDGAVPVIGDEVEVHYRGTLADGTEFDSSYTSGQPITFPVDGVIPGWVEALQLMPVGSKWRLTIPSELAYGAGGRPPVIGPNQVLIFEVELLSITTQDAGAAEAEEAPAEEAAAG